jgi:hypothetical protein
MVSWIGVEAVILPDAGFSTSIRLYLKTINQLSRRDAESQSKHRG